MSTISDLRQAVKQAKTDIDVARWHYDTMKAALVQELAAERAARIAAREAREAARLVKQQQAEAKRQAAVEKLEQRLAKARERAMRPVGIKQARANRRPGPVTVTTTVAGA